MCDTKQFEWLGGVMNYSESMFAKYGFVEELISVKSASKMFNVCERTIRRMYLEGELPYAKIRGRIRFKKEDLIECIEKNTVRS